MTRTYPTAFALTGVLLIAGCGSSDSTSTSSAGNSVDRAFVAQMVPHHESAVQMANIAKRRGSSMFVKQLAGNIARTQTVEISTMQAADMSLRKAGVKRGSLGVAEHMMGMDGDVGSLKTARPFDAAFLRMMIPHHQGAVRMANAELKKGKDRELKTLARNIITAQQREIAQMRKHLGDDSKMNEGANMHGSGAMHASGHSG